MVADDGRPVKRAPAEHFEVGEAGLLELVRALVIVPGHVGRPGSSFCSFLSVWRSNSGERWHTWRLARPHDRISENASKRVLGSIVKTFSTRWRQ